MDLRSRWLRLVIATAGLVALGGASPARPDQVDAVNLGLVAEIPIARGTHLEFMTREAGGTPHVFALEGSRDTSEAGGWDSSGGGLNIIDISDPEHPEFVTNVPCKTDNLDIATVTYAAGSEPVVNGVAYDTVFALASNRASTGCTVTLRDGVTKVRGNSVQFAGIRAGAVLVPGTRDVDFLGSPVLKPDGSKFQWGSKFAHTVAKHPKLPIVYASNQELGTRSPTVEIIDMAGIVGADGNWHPVVRSAALPPTGTGPHDITFSPDGRRAFVSSISQSFIWDTSGDNVLAPQLVTALVAPGLKLHHEGTLHPDGRHLLVTDEFVAVSSGGQPTATGQCPGGGVHVFDLGAGSALEQGPPQVGVFFANDVSTPTAQFFDPADPQGSLTRGLRIGCTAHEFTIAPDGRWMPMAWYGAGVRLFDLTGLVRAASLPAPTPVVVPEFGHYKTPGIDIWAAKVHPALPGYVFASDEITGFKVFRVEASALP